MECRCIKSIDLIPLSSINKSMMSYSYHVIIARFNEYRSALFFG